MRVLTLTMLAALFALSGCATTGNLSSTTTHTSTETVDAQKVAALNHQAQQRGVRIIWVHMPRKKVAIASR